MEIKRNGNAIVWNKKVSVPIMPKDMFIFSPADKMVYVCHNEANSAIVTGYNRKGVAVGSYEYKNSKITRLFLRNGYANIVYCFSEPNGNLSWYQARLLNIGFCTEIYYLHCTENEGTSAINGVSEQEAPLAAENGSDAEINDILASVLPSVAEDNTSEPSVDMETVYNCFSAISDVPLTEPVTPVNPLLKPVPTTTVAVDDDEIEDIEEDTE